ncbi:MAG: hypothetical protein EOP04_15980, partial [Proteobacteria bacterium]
MVLVKRNVVLGFLVVGSSAMVGCGKGSEGGKGGSSSVVKNAGTFGFERAAALGTKKAGMGLTAGEEGEE